MFRDVSPLFPGVDTEQRAELRDGDVIDGRWLITELPNPSGLCLCGCDTPAPIARETSPTRKRVKGYAMQYCHGHNAPPRRPRTSLAPHERYRVDESGCWVWLGSCLTTGYGQIWIDGRTYRAHRWMYERHHGPIPTGLQLDHLCRNRACVNPDHLEPVTNAENSRRGSMAKLTVCQVLEIREAEGTLIALGARYGVSPSTIWMIKHERSWVGAEQSVTSPPPPRDALLGVAPTPTTGLALVRPLAPRSPVVTPLECAVPGCGITAAQNVRGYCQPHDDAFLTRAHDLTRTLGRGSFDE